MQHRIGVVIHRPLAEQLFAAEDRQRLESLGQVSWASADEALSVADASVLLAECTIGIGSWQSPHPGSPGLLAACPALELWEHAAGSVKRFFSPEVDKRNLTIASAKGAIADSVAEYVIGQMIIGLRQMLPNAKANRSGPSGKPAGLKVLSGSTIGIVGASAVGRQVMALLQPFGARIRCFDPFLSPEDAADLGVEPWTDLLAMMEGLDVLSIHTPLVDATRGQIHGAHFRALPDDCLLINAARGECIVEADLVSELEAGRLQAFLDVTSPEPAAPNSPLRRLDNVLLTSHIAGPATTLIGKQAVDDVAAYIDGRQPRHVIAADQLAYTA